MYCGHHKERGNRPAAPAALAPAAPAAVAQAVAAGAAAIGVPRIPRLPLHALGDIRMPAGHPLLRNEPAAPPPRMYEQVDAMLRTILAEHGMRGLEYAARNAAEMARAERRRRAAEAAEAEAAARAAAEALRLAVEAERNAEFQRQLREEPVVFQRDPEGGIDLAAFARDTQNVHRSSVQSMAEKQVRKLIQRPIPADQDTLTEIFAALGGPAVRWFAANNPDRIQAIDEQLKTRVLTEFTDNYFVTEAFSIKYSAVVDSVWAFIRSHASKDDLTVRLAQELVEGLGMCSNGKMARLVNVLQGFDETVEAPVAPMEVFQNKIAAVAQMPMSERKTAADALFNEYGIPHAERADWLAPLLESD